VSASKLRLAFAGTPDLAAKILEFILKDSSHIIDHIYSQPDRPAGRGKKVHACAVKMMAEKHHIQIFQPEKSSLIDLDNRLSKVDLLVVAAYGMILPEHIINRPRYGSINVHTSLLPRWRGAAPIQRAIEAGDKETGITIMQMDAGLDTGDILLKDSCNIGEEDTAGSMHDKLSDLGAKSLIQVLDELASTGITPIKQNNAEATYAKKTTKQEASIDWSKSAIDIERKIRAFNPSPVAYTVIEDLRIRIWGAETIQIEKQAEAAPGTVIISNDRKFMIQTGDGLISIKKLQLPGKKVMAVGDFLNGNPGFVKNMAASF
jgi:methionyl-tRNA formyltransferase